MKFGLAIFYNTEKTGVAKNIFVSSTFVIKCQGQIEAMGHRITSYFRENTRCSTNTLFLYVFAKLPRANQSYGS